MYIMDTQRLTLRPWHIEDLDDFHEYCAMPDVGPNAGWLPHTSLEDSLFILKNAFIDNPLSWAIEIKGLKKVIGSIGLRQDEKRNCLSAYALGYSMSHDFWGHGYMTEAARRMVEHAFKVIKARTLSCYHYPHNIRSKRVIEKCGFKYEGTLRCCTQLETGEVFDELCYSMTRLEYDNEYKQH